MIRVLVVILALVLSSLACDRTVPETTPARIPEASKTATVYVPETPTPYPTYTRQPEIEVTVLVEVTRVFTVTKIIYWPVTITPTPTDTPTPSGEQKNGS